MLTYWARADSRAMHAIDGLDFTSWFDRWHTHVDWRGRGNAHPDNRGEVCRILVRLLGYLESRVSERSEPIQLWATLCPDTTDSAVYLHSPNPNGTPFPADLGDVQWGAPAPVGIAEALAGGGHDIGTVRYGDEVIYLVRRRF